LSERVARKFFRQLASAMYYMHERNIAHMDLKPHNLVLTNTYRPSLKVADFGFAQHLRNSDDDDKGEGWTSKKFRGSLLYMAPEIYKRENYDARVDLWSVGVIL
jgi:serine/threonine-protein kinase ULK/ATG1